jgi:hypothetical protein
MLKQLATEGKGKYLFVSNKGEVMRSDCIFSLIVASLLSLPSFWNPNAKPTAKFSNSSTVYVINYAVSK